MTRTIAELAVLWATYPILWTPKASADGKWLAWSWSGATETANAWVAPTDGSVPPRRLTQGNDHFFVNAISADGGTLILSQGSGGNERDRLFRLKVAPGHQPEPLTAHQHDYYVLGGAFHPDGRSLLYSANHDPATAAVTNGSLLHVLDLEDRECRVIVRADCIIERNPEISGDGSRVLYHRTERHPAGSQVWLVNWDGSGDREIYNAGDNLRAVGHWLDDGEQVLILADTTTHARIGILNLGSGQVEWIIDDPARGIEDVVVGHDGRRIMLVEYTQGALHPRLLDLATRVETPLHACGRSLLPLAERPDGCWVAESYSSAGPHEFVAIGVQGSQLIASAEFPGFSRSYVAGSDFRWRSTDGERVQGWLYEPAGRSRGLIAMVHGGPTWHSEDWVNPAIQFLVACGFTVLDPNYRGSTGFGRRFRELIKVAGWGGREQDDIRSGIEALLAAGHAQRGRIGMTGNSYGGYSSWIAITRFADLVDAASPLCAMYDLAIDYHNTGMPHGRAYSEEMMGGTPEQFPDRYFSASPKNFISAIRGRLMIVHGLGDTNVSPANMEHAARDLDALGIPYRLLTFADEGHGIYKAGNRARWLAATAEFFIEAFEKVPARL